VAVKYKNTSGAFIDSVRLIKVTKKVMLADSLKIITELQEKIIKRYETKDVNCNEISKSFNEYREVTKKELSLTKSSYRLKLVKRDVLIGILFSLDVAAIAIWVFK
jgi:hypothetical protein